MRYQYDRRILPHVNFGSVWRGIRAMRHSQAERKAGWSVRRAHGWWVVAFTPMWEDGRGPYLSIGLAIIAIYRGY